MWFGEERHVTREAKILVLLSYCMNSVRVCHGSIWAHTPRKWKKSPIKLMNVTSDGLVYVEVAQVRVQVQALVGFKARLPQLAFFLHIDSFSPPFRNIRCHVVCLKA